MAINSKYVVPFRRRRQQKTDYKQRLNLLKSGALRVVVRLKKNTCIIQLVDFDGKSDKTLLNVNAVDLKKLGWKHSTGNIPASYLAGYMFGKKAKDMKVEEAIFDLGLNRMTKGGRVAAVMKGVVDSGLEVPANLEELAPSEDRIKGEHIASFVENAPKGQFSKDKPKSIVKDFDAVMKKL